MTRQTDHTITVVIPTFNRRAHLQTAVESVLAERRVPIALHIFDNASTDETEKYGRALAAQDLRVSYTRRSENIGATGNYSQALASISTEYFVPLADDDCLLREERARMLAEQNDRKRIDAETELESLGGHPLLEAMKKLRLLRFSKAA
ncbi:glycosyltransferase family 2 protein [Variovorax sp. MHTC-1]|uniref:glycosyltransferase family 2 protein n=1 Tax=Variovorax sp. MHTC-1 TaxID=2495593 RepID=UPI000F869002|nr:glycosyltransferase [Variovorax sp. MHTC-1]RST54309.1 glycosyltransferase family 2 protein [Variovorax sp. MHTC-1]